MIPPTNAGIRFEVLESFEHSDGEEPVGGNTRGLVRSQELENDSSGFGSEMVADSEVVTDSSSSILGTSPSDGNVQLSSAYSPPSFRDPGSTRASVDSNMGDKIDNVWRCDYEDCDKTFSKRGSLK